MCRSDTSGPPQSMESVDGTGEAGASTRGGAHASVPSLPEHGAVRGSDAMLAS